MAYTEKQIDQIVVARNKGTHWAEIVEKVGGTQGAAMLAFDKATVGSNDRIVAKTEDDLKKKIAKARQEGQSWGKVMARSGKSETYCRKAFEEVTGESASGNRIGKGGRHPGEGNVPKAKGVKAKTAAKATGVVKSAAKKAPAKKVAKKQAVAKKAAAKKAVAKKTAAEVAA